VSSLFFIPTLQGGPDLSGFISGGYGKPCMPVPERNILTKTLKTEVSAGIRLKQRKCLRARQGTTPADFGTGRLVK